MPKILLTILDELSKKPLSTPEATNALEALLSVATEPLAGVKERFKAALMLHKDFWIAQDLSANFLINEEAEHITKLKQGVAEARVMQGLQAASPQTLVELFSGLNEKALLQYMNEKLTNNKLQTVPGWTSEPALHVPGRTIITLEAEARIKEAAAQLVIAQKIAAAKDDPAGHLLLQKLINPIPSEQKAALEALGVPRDAAGAIITPAALKSAKDLYDKRAYSAYLSNMDQPTLLGLKATLEANSDQFQAHIRTAFGGGGIFTPEQITTAKGLLGTKYLQAHFSTQAPPFTDLVALKTALNSTDKGVVATFIQTQLYPGSGNAVRDKYIADAVDTNPTALKTSLMQNYVKTLKLDQFSDLTALTSAADLPKFKAGLAKLGVTPADWVSDIEKAQIIATVKEQIQKLKDEQFLAVKATLNGENPAKLKQLAEAKDVAAFKALINNPPMSNVDWVGDAEMIKIQKAARNRLFELKFEQISGLGAKSHQELLNALAKLSPESQNKLLADDKLSTLRALTNINDKVSLKAIFGNSLTDPAAQALVDENKRLAIFKQIHNPAIAKVLANLEPPIPISKELVKKINDKLLIYDVTPNSLRNLVTIYLPPIFLSFHDGLTGAMRAARVSIHSQQRTNLPLLELYHQKDANDDRVRKPAETAMLDVLLRLNSGGVVYKTPRLTLMASLNTLLDKHHKSAKEFIQAIDATVVPDLAQRKTLQAALTLELSEGEFVQIQKERRKTLFAENPVRKTELIGEIAASLAELTKKEKVLLDTASKLNAFIESKLFSKDSNAAMVFGPAFDVIVKERPVVIKKELEALLQKTTAIVEQLKENKLILQAHLASLPGPKIPPDKEIEKLRDNLNKELKELELDGKLGKYLAAQTQLKKMVTEVNRVIDGKEHYLYHSSEITHKTCSEAELVQMRRDAASKRPTLDLDQQPLADVEAEMDGDEDLPANVRKKSLGAQQEYFVFEVVDKSKVPAYQQRGGAPVAAHDVTSKGTFALNYSAGPASVQDGNDVRRGSSCKVQQIQPPTAIAGSTGTEITPQAKSTYYMNMAMALITANGGKPPSKEHPIKLRGGSDADMECLWTAFMIIGAESKIKFGREALKIQTGGFNPDKVMSTSWGKTVFSPDSAYERIFKEKTPQGKSVFLDVVSRKKDQANAIHGEAAETGKALTEATSTTSAFKGLLQTHKSTVTKIKEKVSSPDVALDILAKLGDPLSPTNTAAQLVTHGLGH